LDHVQRIYSSPFTNFVVQLNTGSGFGPAFSWGPVDPQGMPGTAWGSVSASTSGETCVDLLEINGDGLPYRVSRSRTSPYDHLVVQLNKGPFPDLMNVISNGLGGAINVGYVPSTTLDNRDTNWVTDPWSEGTKSLLPFPVYVVSQISVMDGMGASNTTSYAFKGGYFSAP